MVKLEHLGIDGYFVSSWYGYAVCMLESSRPETA
jgi:hypothetical protein